MYKKLLSVIFLLLIFIFKSDIFMQQLPDQILNKKSNNLPTLIEIIKNDLKDAQQGLNETKDLLKNIKIYFKKSSYLKSTQISMEKGDQGGIYLNFGYTSHGELTTPFTGFKTKVDFKKVPAWLEDVFVKTLISMGFDSIINITPQNEFLIKLILLFNDIKKKLITKSKVPVELLFLFYRLALVKEVNDFKSFFGDDNNLIYKMISNIKINGKSISAFLNNYWSDFKEIVNYNFSLEEGDPYNLTPHDLIESNDWKMIVEISAAIGLRTSIDYYKAREKFLKTSKGSELNSKILNATTKKERLKCRKEFATALPEYQNLLLKTKLRVHGFLRRIKGIRKYWNPFVEKIRLTLEPFFDSIGLPFDLIVSKFDDIDHMDASEKFYDDSKVIFDNQDLSKIDFDIEANFDITNL